MAEDQATSEYKDDAGYVRDMYGFAISQTSKKFTQKSNNNNQCKLMITF